MKRVISLLLAVIICVSFSGCDLYKGKTKIVGVTYENEIFNAVQNQECMAGLKLMNSELRIAYFENENPEEFEQNLKTIVNERHDFIWCFEAKSKDALERVAALEESKNTKFGLIDATYEDIPSNVTTLTFREHEGAFIAGYIAAKTTQAGTIGFLGGEETEISRKYEYGYKAGALYGGKEIGKKINVITLYTGDDHSKESGKEGATTLYNTDGCDIIFQASQVTGLGAIEAAVQLDKLIIGNGTDQSTYGPKNVLTSVTKNVKNAINRVTTMLTEEQEIGGKNFNYGIKERVIGIAKTNTNMAKDLYREASDLKDAVGDGKIDVPYDEASYLKYAESL